MAKHPAKPELRETCTLQNLINKSALRPSLRASLFRLISETKGVSVKPSVTDVGGRIANVPPSSNLPCKDSGNQVPLWLYGRRSGRGDRPAHLLGGAITAQSGSGQGSTFTLYLPIAHPDFEDHAALAEPSAEAQEAGEDELAEAGPPAAPAPQHRRLLVIEQRPRGLLSLVTETVVTELSGRWDETIELVTAAGVQEAAATLADQPCHCIVLDLDLPEGAAYHLLETMESDPALAGVPVLAYSSWRTTQQETLLRSHSPARPLEQLSSLDELRERIALHLTANRAGEVPPLIRREPAQAPAAVKSDSPLAGRTVLVVDDDTRNLFALTSMLESHGMAVLHAENGRLGIDTLIANPDIDLVLMDVMMPEMDGYAATSAIRAMPQYADLPIIAVTAKAMPGDKEKSIAAGASDYVTKPVEIGHLVDRIRHCLNA